ncbi:hypothetical protein EV175_002581 [Coemansia sp. RSA 1933]|nr:hypothetical protein EV175_002581 [Coemansia sp. RSA 1933]
MSAERFKLCLACYNNLAASSPTMPSMATCRVYEFAAPNPDVATLNEVEQRLVAARHPFQATWPVHGAIGQLRAMGPVINIPVSPSETTESCVYSDGGSTACHIEAAVNKERVRRSAAYLEQQPSYVKHGITFNPNWTATDVPFAQESAEDTTHQHPEADDGADPGTTAQASNHAMDIGEDSAIDEDLDIGALIDNIKTLVVSGNDDLMDQLPRNAADDGSAYGVSVAPAESHRPLAFAYDPDAPAFTFPTIFFENNIPAIEGNDVHTFTRECKFIIENSDARGRRYPKLLLYLNFLKQFVQLHNSMHIVMRSRNAGNNGRLIQARDPRSADSVLRMISEDHAF